MIMELGRKKVRLGELLVNSGVLSNEQLQQALDNPARQGKKLGEFLVDEGIVSEDDLAKALRTKASILLPRSPCLADTVLPDRTWHLLQSITPGIRSCGTGSPASSTVPPSFHCPGRLTVP